MPSYSTQLPLSLETEEWRPVVGCEGWYEVSSLGRVKRLVARTNARAGHILKPGSNHATGYLHVTLCCDGRRFRNRTIHRLVSEAFLGSCPAGHEVNHGNGIKTDNRAANLEWTTHSANELHSIRTGLRIPVRGEQHPFARLTENQVRQIRALVGTCPLTHIARRFGISDSHVQAIRDRKKWAHI